MRFFLLLFLTTSVCRFTLSESSFYRIFSVFSDESLKLRPPKRIFRTSSIEFIQAHLMMLKTEGFSTGVDMQYWRMENIFHQFSDPSAVPVDAPETDSERWVRFLSPAER